MFYAFPQKTAWIGINAHLRDGVFVYIWRKTDFGKCLRKITEFHIPHLPFFLDQNIFNMTAFWEFSFWPKFPPYGSDFLKPDQFSMLKGRHIHAVLFDQRWLMDMKDIWKWAMVATHELQDSSEGQKWWTDFQIKCLI